MKVELKGIEIAMGEKSVKLSITEAQELRKQLNELFNEKIVTIPTSPIIIEKEVWPWWKGYYPPNVYPPSITYTSVNPEPTIQVYCCTE